AQSDPREALAASARDAPPVEARDGGRAAAVLGPGRVQPGHAAEHDAHPSDARPLLRIGSPDSATQVYATAETRRFRRDGVLLLDAATEAWLADRVQPGDVLYDVGAGIGAYSIQAAVLRGALAVA